MEALAQAVLGRIFIELEASGRHVHVTKEQAITLFGHPLTPKRPLSQPGQFLANERVTVVGPKGEFQNVAVLGPERKEAQVEISLTDSRSLGIIAPKRVDYSKTINTLKLVNLKSYNLVNKELSASATLCEIPKVSFKIDDNKEVYVITNKGNSVKVEVKTIPECKFRDKGTS